MRAAPRTAYAGALVLVLVLVALVVVRTRDADAPEGRSPAPAPAASGSTDPESRVVCGDPDQVAADLAALEERTGARVGVHVVVPATGETLGYRDDERFAFASTIKALAAAAVLEEAGPGDLDRRVREALDAAVTLSDNAAGNLLLDVLGGPAALDERLEDAGDDVTRVERREPDLNDYTPGDDRDTTTPAALAGTLAAYALGPRLPRADRALLNDLLERNTTGDALVRAVVPDDWTVGDKTGTASYGTRNDVAVVRPPGRPPLVLAVMTRHGEPDAAADDALVADAARVVVRAVCR
ncbi:serine hydrolase [Nocardioides dongkuii]|uniref:serine hydrolase n=1 Tax=Nocardioides dongkuii TaxID=2760089 RepID=UPI0015FC9F37|nr:serine hydrolase [Nocardioides dongkuii]